MGLRNQKNSRKLSIKKETLRALELRTLSDDELRAAAGGKSAGCSVDCPAPSHCGC